MKNFFKKLNHLFKIWLSGLFLFLIGIVFLKFTNKIIDLPVRLSNVLLEWRVFEILHWSFWIAFVIFMFYGIWYLYYNSRPKSVVLFEDVEQAKYFLKIHRKAKKIQKALFVNAPLGSGKTSFCVKSLMPLLKSTYPERQVLKVSCLGMKTCDQVVSQVLLKSNYAELVSAIFIAIKQAILFSPGFKQALIPRNLIIILEDFELAPREFYQEILGLINYLILEKDSYIFVFGDENNIDDSSLLYNKASAKIFLKERFIISPEVLGKILTNFNDEGYRFSQVVIKHFIRLSKVNMGVRDTLGAWHDFREIGEQLVQAIKRIPLEPHERELILERYFSNDCGKIIKAMFIKNSGLIKAYEQYVDSEKSEKNEILSKYPVLSELERVNLSEMQGYNPENDLKLFTKFEAYYLDNGTRAYDSIFFKILIEDVLFSMINSKANQGLKDAYQGFDEEFKANFFRFFKFSLTEPLLTDRYYHPMVIVAFMLSAFKREWVLTENEKQIFLMFARFIGKERVSASIESMISHQMVDSECGWLNYLDSNLLGLLQSFKTECLSKILKDL